VTCIAIRGRVIAADSQLTVDESLKYDCDKLFKVRDGIIGFVGATAPGMELLHHLQKHSCLEPIAGVDEYHRADFGALLLTKHGVYLYDESLSPDKVRGKFFALGTGALAALGAMDRGADAVEAVRIACKYDAWCRGPVHWVRV
jgi:hypothetical protein